MAEIKDPNNPIDDAMLARLKQGKAKLNEAMILCQRMTDCGLDCRTENAYCQALAERYDKIFQHFGGGRVSR